MRGREGKRVRERQKQDERQRERERGRETHTHKHTEGTLCTEQRGCDQSQIKSECADKDTLRERERKGEIDPETEGLRGNRSPQESNECRQEIKCNDQRVTTRKRGIRQQENYLMGQVR